MLVLSRLQSCLLYTSRDPRALAAFNELMTAVKKLELLVQGAGGRPNKELKQMARQAEKLYEEWNEARL